jgi:hypothetical protein
LYELTGFLKVSTLKSENVCRIAHALLTRNKKWEREG